MEENLLKTAAIRMTMPEEMKERILQNCKEQKNTKEKYRMHKSTHTGLVRRSAAALTALAICLTLSVTAMAASGTLKGFFRDLTDNFGAIVGTSYEQATEEIRMDTAVTGNELTVSVSFVNPQMPPYSETERLGIAAYQITDENGKVQQEGSVDASQVLQGQAVLTIPLRNMESGVYKLLVTAFVSEKKADQPLKLHGNWECSFRK